PTLKCMKIALASDHRGYEAKRRLLPVLKKLGHEVSDFGCDSATGCDYPDYALPAAQAVADGRCEVGVLLDGTGIGMSIAANKVDGILAALAHDEVTARIARSKNHCNVLCLGSDLLGEDHLRAITEIFLNTPFEDGRHVRRLEKIHDYERTRPARPPNAGKHHSAA
ncbi:MAG: ribose 5-phosphate isomerase B, partial [Tepidisphaeraceae bacterium]